jgi:CubicO group peptidase (beta-lactamase class C family)
VAGGLSGAPAGAAAWQAGTSTAPDLGAAFRRAARIPALTSLLVARGDRLLGERYFHGGSESRVVNVKSVSKSVLSALVGIAIAEGRIRDTEATVGELLPDYARRIADPRKRAITVGDLLSMRAGLATTSFGQYGAWVTSPDWVLAALRRPLECDPGSCWIYSTGNYHLLSVILTRTTGLDTRSYAARKLLGPLGIPARPWDRDPRGYYLGGNNMGFTARELLRFGRLYLAEGRREERQVVPADWVRRSLRPLVVSSFNGLDYGYGWWGRRLAGEAVRFAWGYGGQYVILVPSLDLVVVATTAPGRESTRFEADRALFDLLRDEVIPVVRGDRSPADP